MRDSGELDLLTKKEGLMIERDIERLEHRLSGIRKMSRLPDVLFVVDIQREDTAIHESNLKEIPVVAMVDTNCDPKNVDYVIPSNDDAIRAIKLLVGKMADAVMEGKTIRGKEIEEEDMRAESKPAEVARFIEDDDELEDDVLLGESTLKHLGSTRKEALDEESEELPKEVEAGLDEEPAAEEPAVEETKVDDEEPAAEESVEEESADDEEPAAEEPVEEETAAEEPAEDDEEPEVEELAEEDPADDDEEPEVEEPAEEDPADDDEDDNEEDAEDA